MNLQDWLYFNRNRGIVLGHWPDWFREWLLASVVPE